ncbi:MAG: ACT domain-containing protein, partial [Clostridia bacterium]
TKIKEAPSMEKMDVSGVAKDKNIARVSLVDLDDVPGIAFKIFSTLAAKKINVDIILQSIGRDNTKDVSFTIASDNLSAALDTLNANKDKIGFKNISVNDKVCKLSIVGSGMVNNPGVASMMFEALANENVNIQMISTSELKVSVLIDEKDVDRALIAVHDKFFG